MLEYVVNLSRFLSTQVLSKRNRPSSVCSPQHVSLVNVHCLLSSRAKLLPPSDIFTLAQIIQICLFWGAQVFSSSSPECLLFTSQRAAFLYWINVEFSVGDTVTNSCVHEQRCTWVVCANVMTTLIGSCQLYMTWSTLVVCLRVFWYFWVTFALFTLLLLCLKAAGVVYFYSEHFCLHIITLFFFYCCIF